jgi:glutamate--cysteine ligase
VRPDGRLATTPHPAALGAALTHPNITTDFSESQLELITVSIPDTDACVQELTRSISSCIARSVMKMLWSSSMPCRLPPTIASRSAVRSLQRGPAEDRVPDGPVAPYGSRMQTISGFTTIFRSPSRRWLRCSERLETRVSRRVPHGCVLRADPEFPAAFWLPLYLFGASPATCRSFVEGRSHRLQDLSRDTLYLPHATSLRMGPLGYQSDAQRSLAVSYNSLAGYAGSLHHALTEPYPQYAAIGVRDGRRGYRQLATTLLQIENEFYGTIRPKRRINRGERPLHALTERGVEYVEVRSLDVDPFSPVGVAAATMRFFDVFLLHCLLAHSPPDAPEEIATIAQNSTTSPSAAGSPVSHFANMASRSRSPIGGGRYSPTVRRSRQYSIARTAEARTARQWRPRTLQSTIRIEHLLRGCCAKCASVTATRTWNSRSPDRLRTAADHGGAVLPPMRSGAAALADESLARQTRGGRVRLRAVRGISTALSFARSRKRPASSS